MHLDPNESKASKPDDPDLDPAAAGVEEMEVAEKELLNVSQSEAEVACEAAAVAAVKT